MTVPLRAPTCMLCTRYRGNVDCDAFPERIPDSIWLGQNPHTAEVEGDHGLRFDFDGNKASAAGGVTQEQLLAEFAE